MESTSPLDISSLDELYEVLPELHYEPLWTMKGALTPEPVTSMVPFLWSYAEVRGLILRAGELISAADADRRVLALKNPGTKSHELARATDTLWAAVQLVLPGEIAPPHRHTPAALRLIIEGTGGYTVVDGQRVDMERGDFLITPNWSWHEHGQAGDGPMIWLDGLDIPLVSALHAGFAEFGQKKGADWAQTFTSAGLNSGMLVPRFAGVAPQSSLIWKYTDVEAAFSDLADAPGSPYDDLILEYRDPFGGGPALKTMSAYMQVLRAGVRTSGHRHSSSCVYHVLSGSGTTTIAGTDFNWQRGDTFALPIWAEHSHQNRSSDDAMLFSFSDEPAIDALGLLRSTSA
jgi:gentisate 1,2-dioxygenase